MSPQVLLEYFKVDTQAALAAKLGKPVSTVGEWFQNKSVPKAVQWEVEIMTGGKILAEHRPGAPAP